ncbi:MAG: hypothetical protein WA960_00550 [Tunicatimonas sp.]
MNHSEAESLLRYALNHYGIAVLGSEQNTVQLAQGYQVEVEGPSLYKLLSDGAVVAPFADVDELCQFIKADPSFRG